MRKPSLVPKPIIWHSKADKIVNNFHGQNRFQFHGQTPIFMIKTLIFVVKTDFLMFRPTNFLDHEISWSQNFLVNLHSIPMPKFHAQPYSISILCSTLFHSNSVSWSVTISWSVTAPTYHALLLTFGVV